MMFRFVQLIEKVKTWLRTTSKGEYRIGVFTFNHATGEVSDRDIRFTVTVAFRWYDFWVGLYWDRKDKQLYVCPLPTIAFRIGYQ